MRLELACVLSLSLWPWKKPVGTTVRPVPVLPKISKPPYVSVALLNSGSTQVESTPDAVRRLAAWQADSSSSDGVSNIVVFQLLAAIASSFALGIACAGRNPKTGFGAHQTLFPMEAAYRKRARTCAFRCGAKRCSGCTFRFESQGLFVSEASCARAASRVGWDLGGKRETRYRMQEASRHLTRGPPTGTEAEGVVSERQSISIYAAFITTTLSLCFAQPLCDALGTKLHKLNER